MFTKITPQKVQHTTGFIVQVADRQTVEYLEKGRSASVEVYSAVSTVSCGATLSGLKTEHGVDLMDNKDRPIVLEKIADGLRAMGIEKVEIC